MTENIEDISFKRRISEMMNKGDSDFFIELTKMMLDVLKPHIVEFRPQYTYEADVLRAKAESKRVDYDYMIRLLEMQMQAAADAEKWKFESVQMRKDLEDRLFEEHMDIITGWFGFRTKARKLESRMIAQYQARDLLGGDGYGPPSPAMSLPNPALARKLLDHLAKDEK